MARNYTTKNIFKPMLAAALIVLPCAAMSQVEGARPTDGVWGGGYSIKYSTIQATFQAVGDLAQLDLDMKGWGEEKLTGKCHYIIALNDNGVGASYPTEAYISNGSCPQEIDFTVSRDGPGKILLSLSGEGAALFTTEAFELYARLRPPLAADLRNPVPNLDILGIAPGMSEGEARELLEGQGFSLVAEDVNDFGFFTRRRLAYGRKPGIDNKPADFIGIRMSVEADWLNEDPVVMLVGRAISYFAEESMTETKLKEALLAKYGPSTHPTTHERYWSRDGEVDSNLANALTGKTVPFVADIAGSRSQNSKISIDGGPLLRVKIREPISRTEGDHTIQMTMIIEDPDPIWKDFWLTWAHQRYGELQQIMDREGANTAAPEL